LRLIEMPTIAGGRIFLQNDRRRSARDEPDRLIALRGVLRPGRFRADGCIEQKRETEYSGADEPG